MSKPKKQATTETIVAYKGFDSDWTCRGYQFAIGQTYEHAGPVKACESGFHACEYPLHVLRYYKPAQSVYAVVEQSGTLDRRTEDTKVASSRLTVTAQIDLAGLIKAAIKYTMDRCTPAAGGSSDKPNTSVSAEGARKCATASGNSGAATASGDSGAATASGYYGAATASGDSGAATASGNSGAATASGRNGRARGADGCALFLVRRGSDWRITHAWAGIVGRDGIKADTWYSLGDDGAPVEVQP